jgi:acylphosphatase
LDSNSKRPLVALAVVAALAVPASAAAKRPAEHHGKGDFHSHKQKGRALNVTGTVAAVGDGTIDVLVKGANHHGRALRGQTVTVDVSNARIVVRDVNGDGNRDLADVAVGDRVLVQSRIAKGETPDPAQPLVAKRVVDKGQKAPDGTGDEPPADGTGDDPPAGGAGDETGGTDTPPTP